jgi:hypothetical protein
MRALVVASACYSPSDVCASRIKERRFANAVVKVRRSGDRRSLNEIFNFFMLFCSKEETKQNHPWLHFFGGAPDAGCTAAPPRRT